MSKIYFVTCDIKEEIAVIKKLKPENLLLSYYYFRKKPLKEWCEKIGYKPNIMLDSGAYSAYTKNKNISLIDYMNYIEENKEYINQFITLDVIGDSEISYMYYKTLKMKGYNPIPVFHFQERNDESWLQKYINDGNTYIALGGSVPEKNKQLVADWVNDLTKRYPEVKFHLLGSSSKKITQGCPQLYSSDSSTWIMMAINGFPKEIKGKTHEDKVARAEWQMNQILNDNNKNVQHTY